MGTIHVQNEKTKKSTKSSDLCPGDTAYFTGSPECEPKSVAMSHPSTSESLSNDMGAVPSQFETRPTPGSATEARLVLEMRHAESGDSRQIPMGYSLRVALLGPIELIRRGDWRSAAVSVLLPVVGQLLLAPTANRAYVKLLVRRGYRAVSREPGQISRIEWMLGLQLPRYAGRSSGKAAD